MLGLVKEVPEIIVLGHDVIIYDMSADLTPSPPPCRRCHPCSCVRVASNPEHGEEFLEDGHQRPSAAGDFRVALCRRGVAVADPLLLEGRRRALSLVGGAVDSPLGIQCPW